MTRDRRQWPGDNSGVAGAVAVEFRVLGPVEVVRQDKPVALAGRRQRAVLARLLMARRSVVAAEQIIEDLWAGRPPPRALGVVQAHVSTLRRLLEPERPPRAPASLLVSRPPGYALLADTDADVFAELVHRGIDCSRSADAVVAERLLGEALARWRGEPYADLSDELWLGPEIARLRELRLVAVEHRLGLAVADHRVHEAVAELEVLVAQTPLREGLWRLLAVGLYRTGRQAEALAALRRARDMLAEELGLDPTLTLRELEAAILAQSPDLMVDAGASVALANPSAGASPSAPPAASLVEDAAASGERPPLLVGREDAIEVVVAAAGDAAAGRPQAVVLSGEPGIGKTWLAEAMSTDRRAEGWAVVWGRCRQGSGAPALWPWLQVLTALAVHHPAPPELQALLEKQLDRAGPTMSTGASDARFQQHHALAQYLATVGDAQPLLIVLDDLQWADAATLDVLTALPALARPGRLLILGTARDGDEARTLGELWGRRVVTRVVLSGLDRAAVAAMARANAVDADPDLLTRRTGGNPFLLRETLRAMTRGGAHAGGVPQTAADMLHQRLAALDPAAVAVLQTAAVVGGTFDVDVLLAAVGQDPDDLLDLLDAAAVAGILVETGDGDLGFAHDLLRETLYGDLPPLRRAQVHARVVHVLRDRPGSEVTTVAAHAVAAGPRLPAAEVVGWTAAAAEQAFTRLGFDDTVRWWRHALRAQDRLADADTAGRVQLLLRLVAAQLAAGDAIGALTSRNTAVRAADRSSDPGLRAAALVAIDEPSLWALRGYDAVDLDMVGRLERALAEPGLGAKMRCRLSATLVNELSYSPDAQTRDRLADDAVAAARAIGDPGLIGFTLNSRFLAYQADPAAWHTHAGPIARELLKLDHRHRLPGLALLAHLILEPASVTGYDIATADAHAVQVELLLRRLRTPLPAMQHQCWRFNRHVLDGQFDDARRVLDAVAAAGLPWWRFGPLLDTTRLGLLWHAGRIDQAEPLLAAVQSVHPAIARDAEILMLAAAGDLDRAATLARQEPPVITRDWMWSFATCLRAAAVAACGDGATRRAMYRDLIPYTGLIATTGTTDAGPVDYYLALLTHALDDPTTTAHHLQVLESRSRQAGLGWWADRARLMLEHEPAAPNLLNNLAERG